MNSSAFLVTFVILFREALEASLIVGIIFVVMGHLKQMSFAPKVWLSIVAGLLSSLIVGGALIHAAESLQGTAEKLIEGVVSLIACGVLTYMVFWMDKQTRKIKTDIEDSLEIAVTKKDYFAFVSLPFLAIFREGAETVLFLGALRLKDPALVSWSGAFAGLVLAVAIAAAIFLGGKKVPLKPLFRSSGIFLLFIAGGLLAYGIHELQELNIIPMIVYPVWNINHILNEKEGIGSFLKALFGYNGNPSLIEVIGYISYFILAIIYLRSRTKSASKKVLALLVAFLFLSSSAYAFDDGDFQVWQTESVDWKLKDNWKANYNQEFYFGDNAKDFYYQHYEIGAKYSGLADWIDLGLSYRLAFEEKNSSWKVEHRPHLNVTLLHKLGEYKVSSRSRIEHRFRQDSDDGWRYRNKITIKPQRYNKFHS